MLVYNRFALPLSKYRHQSSPKYEVETDKIFEF